MFTLRQEPQVIRMHKPGQEVVQENCKRCHDHLNEEVSRFQDPVGNTTHGEGRLCWDCHREVPHGRVNSLSATPYAQVPLPGYPVPEWMKKFNKKDSLP